QGGWPRNPIPP
uniref:Bradykinin-potentiating peptide 11b n=1 Tax=Crotalus adamanteus TaxID=8729 RepID=BP11B_CROAD|nr:RecName: Full=Bradykinin-potentiating peptide 11b; Short=BPP-11b [Crotalus adamanteus]